ncbi:MAG: hypothetical protein ACE15F_00825 [bacterium]
MELDQEQRNQLAQKLRYELARQKADELGVEITDLMERIADGKSSFVKKSEVYLQLDKQRQLLAPKKSIRSLRDGPESLAARIRGEIQLARSRLDEISHAPREGLPPVGDYPTMIQKLENRVNHRVLELEEVEERIERIKIQDPVFGQAEAVLRELHQAREKQDWPLISQLAAAYHPLLKQYETARKSLHPHLEEARQCRLALQKEYAQILKIRFRLQGVLLSLFKKQASFRFSPRTGDGRGDDVSSALALMHKQDETLRLRYAELTVQCPAGHLPVPVASKAWDAVLPHLMDLVEQQAGLMEKYLCWLSALSAPTGPPWDSPPKHPARRMVYIGRL